MERKTESITNAIRGVVSAGNEQRLFWASFLTLIAAGIGFSIRGGILGDWGAQFGFTKAELGTITGGGLTGFGLTIIFFSLFADRVGYGPLMAVAFTLHFLSAVVTLAAGWVFLTYGKEAAYWCLYVGMFMFALGNGTCEAVINPLTATLYPREKTRWLNILHAGWPGGLILGALMGYFMVGRVKWEIQMSLFLIPTVLYGLLMFRQSFPHSEARVAGVTFGTMLKEFAAPLLLFLLVIHAMVGYVELGTDSWISNITGNILADPKKGLLLFIWTSGIMFVLRFFAGPIVHQISPLGLLFVSAVLGAVGLTMLGNAGVHFTVLSAGFTVVLAATIYGFGKTFFWPTMLGVVSERFPRGGALTLGAIGGIGMLSAGLLGGPGIGYKQDYYASQKLSQEAPATFQRYVSPDKKSFLIFPAIAGLDGAKVGALLDKPENELTDTEKRDKQPVIDAGLYGGRMALRWTALVPAIMALCYLGLILYFKTRGGYRAIHITGEEASGGVEGPVEA